MSGASAGRRPGSSAQSQILRRFSVGGSSAWLGRRLFDLATSGVPQSAQSSVLQRRSVGGSLAWPSRRFLGLAASLAILGPGRVEGSSLSLLVGLRRCLSPCTHLAWQDESSTLVFSRVLRMQSYGGFLGEGYPPTLQRSEVPRLEGHP
jgi:hypothetical protein